MRREIKGRGVLHHQNGVVREAPFYRSPTMRGTNGVRMDPRRGPQPVRPFGCRPGSTRRRHTRFWLGGKGSDNMTEARVKSHITQRNIMQFRIDPRLASCVQHAQSPSSLRSPTGAKAIMTAHERRLQWRGTLAVVCRMAQRTPGAMASACCLVFRITVRMYPCHRPRTTNQSTGNTRRERAAKV